MNIYRVFGLTLSSTLEMPELESGSGAGGDIEVLPGSVPSEIEQPLKIQGNWQAGEREFLFRHPRAGNLLVERGRRVVVEPSSFSDAGIMRQYLLGSAMGALLQQRNTLMLHASAVANEKGAILLCGRSGAGKSTTASAFLREGYSLLCDDQAVISQSGPARVFPAYPQAKLWRRSLEMLEMASDPGQRLLAGRDKFAVPVRRNFCREPQPLRAIFVLLPHSGPVERETLKGPKKISALIAQTYRKQYLVGSLLQANFELCAKLTNSVPVFLLSRPENRDSLSEVIASAEECL